jgi:hypothetical protein
MPRDGATPGATPGPQEHDQAEASVAQALKPAEADRLAQLEATIRTGIQTFVEVGLALTEIRNAKLYRATHSTFESYCRERWGWTRQHANRVIGASTVALQLEPTGSTAVSERAIRPLVKLAPEKRAEVWTRAKAAAGDKPVTHKDVEAVVADMPPTGEVADTEDAPDESRKVCFCGGDWGHVNQPVRCSSARLDRCLSTIWGATSDLESWDVSQLRAEGHLEWIADLGALEARLGRFRRRLEHAARSVPHTGAA